MHVLYVMSIITEYMLYKGHIQLKYSNFYIGTSAVSWK
jgi:hypothetical protein